MILSCCPWKGGVMKTIILDFGSGNTCRNDIKILFPMIDALAKIDKKRVCIIKWQLFKDAGNNCPLSETIFDIAYHYAADKGFKTTASVFDYKSLKFLLKYDIPFVKIANDKKLYKIIDYIPKEMPVVISHNGVDVVMETFFHKINFLSCVSKYPSDIEQYEKIFSQDDLHHGISDHTCNSELYQKYNPNFYECHFKLPSSTGLDAGPFARTPQKIMEMLNYDTN